MAITAQGSGTQTATVGTEHTLLDVAIAGVFQLEVNLINMVALDMVELRVYAIILTGGTRAVVDKGSRYDAQPTDDMIIRSEAIMNELTDAGALRFTLKQTLGTSRTFDWKVLRAQ
jgi:hypothetical protein